MGSTRRQKLRTRFCSLLRSMSYELWEPNGWTTMGVTWLGLFLIIFPGSVILKTMKPDQVVISMAGFGLLLFYGSGRGMTEAIALAREKVWSTVELILFYFIGLPPLLLGGFLSVGGVIILIQKLFSFSPQG